jgi:hypothetical protein
VDYKEKTEMGLLDRIIGMKSTETRLKEATAELEKGNKLAAWWEAKRAKHVEDVLSVRKERDEFDRQAIDAAVAAAGDGELELPDLSACPYQARLDKLEADGKVIDRGLSLAKRALTPLRAAVSAAALAHSDFVFASDAREMHRLLTQITPISKRLAATRQKHQPDLTLHWLSDEMFEGWVFGFKGFVDKQPKPEPDPNTTLTFIKPFSLGGLSGIRYNPGDGAAFSTEKAAEIVAGGFAVWQKPTAENQKLTEAAKRRLAAIDSTAGDTRVDVGWVSNDAA